MTIIASYVHKKIGATLVGDLLTSNEHLQLEEQLFLPARWDGDRPTEASHIAGMAQKLNLISSTFAIAWAGSKLVAQSILRSLRTELPAPQTTDEVFSFIYNLGYSQAELDSVSLTFLIYGKENTEGLQIFSGSHNCQTRLVNDDMQIKFAGTGEYHFFDSVVLELNGMVGDHKEENSGAYQFLAAMIARGAISFFAEHQNWGNYTFSYGGSFEYIQPWHDRWVKVPYSVMFWLKDGDSFRPVNPITIHTYKSDGTLVVDQVLPSPEGTQHRRFLVDTMFGNTSPPHSQLALPLEFGFSVHIIIDKDNPPIRENGELKSSISTQISWGDNQPCKIKISEDMVNIEWFPERIKRLAS